MKRVIVRYKVKTDRADENVAFVKKVFEELTETQPPGLKYATFQSADGVSFTHIAEFDPQIGNPLSKTEAFRKFQENIQDRCVESPTADDVEIVGSYKFI